MLSSRYDRDKSGTLDAAEFKKAVRLGMKISPDVLSDSDLVHSVLTARIKKHRARVGKGRGA